MKIASSSVAMESSHLRAERHETSETLRSWRGARPDFEGTRRIEPPAATVPQISETAHAQAMADARDPADSDPMLLLLRTMIEWFTGEPVTIFDASQIDMSGSSATISADVAALQGRRQAGFGIEYDFHALHEEFERTKFTAQGIVRTADGQEIAFSLELTKSRHYREETNVSVRAGDARRKDPLVINFDGNAAQLSSQRFRFDLDADGRAEEVPLLIGGSGYLALDLNGNGRIDSGAELFGPASGSGFAELAQHDEDGNGWIDEVDAVFKRLQVWTPDAAGAGSLTSLAGASVGALYLGQVSTPFELKGDGNEDLGAVRDSGMFLSDSGAAGALQEVDLTV